jgi:hypothetical protein
MEQNWASSWHLDLPLDMIADVLGFWKDKHLAGADAFQLVQELRFALLKDWQTDQGRRLNLIERELLAVQREHALLHDDPVGIPRRLHGDSAEATHAFLRPQVEVFLDR